jgi:kynurenine 3-monooxygenase
LYLVHAFEGENFDLLKERKDVTFETNFPDSIDVIPELAEDFFKNPTSTLVTMKCFPGLMVTKSR